MAGVITNLMKTSKDAEIHDGYSEKQSNRDPKSKRASQDPDKTSNAKRIKPSPAVFNVYYPDPIDEVFGSKLSSTFRATFCIDDAKMGRKGLLQHVGKKIVELVKVGCEERRPRDEIVRESKTALNMIPPANRTSPLGRDGSNIRTPTTWKARQTIHAFLMGVSTGVRPYIKFGAKQDTNEARDAANNQEGFLDSVYTEKIRYSAFQDDYIGMGLDEGTAFAYSCYKREVAFQRDIQVLTPQNAPSFGFELPKDPDNWKPGNKISHKTDKSLTLRLGAIFDGEREFIVKNDPAIEVKSYFDYVQFPARHSDCNTAFISGFREVLDFRELRKMAKARIIDEEQLQQLEESNFTPIEHPNLTNLHLDATESVEDEIDRDDFETPTKRPPTRRDVDGIKYVCSYTQAEFIKVCVQMDGNGDDVDEEWDWMIETSTGIPLITRRFIGSPGQRYLVPFSPFRLPGKLYGMPIGRVLYPIQIQKDNLTNLGLDQTALSMTQIVEELEGNSSNLTPFDLRVGLNYRRVKEFGKMEVHNFKIDNANNFLSAEYLDGLAEETTAVSETFSGTSPRRGQTATETQQLINSGARRLKVAAGRLQDANRQIAMLVMSHIRRYGLIPEDYQSGMVPEVIDYSLTRNGERIYGKLTIQQLFTPVSISTFGDTENTNEALAMQAAEKVFQVMQNDKEFTGGSAETRYNNIAHVLHAFGVRDLTAKMGPPSRAKEMDEQAKENPGPVLPPFPPNLNEEFLAGFLHLNPDSAEGILQQLQRVYAITEPDKLQSGASVEAGLQAAAEVEQAKLDANKKIAASEISQSQRLAEQTASINIESQKRQAELEIETKQKLSEQEIQHKEQMATQKINAASQVANAKTQSTKKAERKE